MRERKQGARLGHSHRFCFVHDLTERRKPLMTINQHLPSPWAPRTHKNNLRGPPGSYNLCRPWGTEETLRATYGQKGFSTIHRDSKPADQSGDPSHLLFLHRLGRLLHAKLQLRVCLLMMIEFQHRQTKCRTTQCPAFTCCKC